MCEETELPYTLKLHPLLVVVVAKQGRQFVSTKTICECSGDTTKLGTKFTENNLEIQNCHNCA